MRFQNWPERLNKIIAESQSLPFVWGEHDCCLFAANVVKELTGDDHTIPFLGKYSTAQTAAKVLKKHGGVRGIASNALGEEINPKLAQRGDIVLIQLEHGDTLSVCVGAHCAGPGLEGLQFVPMSEAVTAWRVK